MKNAAQQKLKHTCLFGTTYSLLHKPPVPQQQPSLGQWMFYRILSDWKSPTPAYPLQSVNHAQTKNTGQSTTISVGSIQGALNLDSFTHFIKITLDRSTYERSISKAHLNHFFNVMFVCGLGKKPHMHVSCNWTELFFLLFLQVNFSCSIPPPQYDCTVFKPAFFIHVDMSNTKCFNFCVTM